MKTGLFRVHSGGKTKKRSIIQRETQQQAKLAIAVGWARTARTVLVIAPTRAQRHALRRVLALFPRRKGHRVV